VRLRGKRPVLSYVGRRDLRAFRLPQNERLTAPFRWVINEIRGNGVGTIYIDWRRFTTK